MFRPEMREPRPQIGRPPAACLPLEAFANGGFQIDVHGVTGDDVPDRWVASRLQIHPTCNSAAPTQAHAQAEGRGDGQIHQVVQVEVQ